MTPGPADPASPHQAPFPVRLWSSGIPLWQKLVVWAGAAGVAWTTLRLFVLAWWFQEGIMPVEPIPPPSDATFYGWCAISLALAAGFGIWPLTRGRWRTVAFLLAVPATLAFLVLSPLFWLSWDMSVGYADRHPDASLSVWLDVMMPPLAYAALVTVWVRAIRDFRARRRGRRARPSPRNAA